MLMHGILHITSVVMITCWVCSCTSEFVQLLSLLFMLLHCSLFTANKTEIVNLLHIDNVTIIDVVCAGAPQNHWFGPAGDPRGAGIGTPEAIKLVWSCHREIIHDNGPIPEGTSLTQT